MAGKQLGKLRQWAGEVIAVRDKTLLPDEFRDLEHDIELRRQGLSKLHIASDGLYRRLSKKKVCEATGDNEKLLPIDALGVVMIQHGEEFGDDSAFGTSLVALGKAHCKVATLQEAFALHFEETYITALQRAEDEIKEYQAQRKKMESRRLTYDAAIAKVEKLQSSKKDKDKERRDAEDEYARAKSRYEDITEDVRARMFAIQEEELDQLKELTNFLTMEMSFVQQYLDVLKETKSEWLDDSTLSQMERSRRPRPSPPTNRSADESRFSSIRSTKSNSRPHSTVASDESEEHEADRSGGKLQKSSSLKKTNSSGSRPQSRTERRRADSAASNSTERGKEKEKQDTGAAKKMGIAGWASSIGKMTGRSKKGRMDSLMGEESDSEDEKDNEPRKKSSPRVTPIKPRLSRSNTPNDSPQMSGRTLKAASQQDRKIAVALHDFAAASSDELSFKAGDQIVVVNEVVDGWWMGELSGTGKTGLFPTTYTEILNASTSSLTSKPTLPRRPSKNALPPSISRSNSGTEDKRKPAWLAQSDASEVSEEDHPFGDNYIAASRSPIGDSYPESISSVGGDDDDDLKRLVPDTDQSGDDFNVFRAPPPVPTRRPSNPSSTVKKAPPPPPPRRATQSSTHLSVPQASGKGASSRSSSRTNSTNASFVSLPPNEPEPEFTSSPFDNPKDPVGCGDFKQNPFKSKGMCNNCFEMHG